jgi:hypothetical protein
MRASPLKTAASWLIMALLLIQFIPLSRSNPPESSPLIAPEKITVILKKACFDCHSFKTKWPLPAYIAPVSWTAYAKVNQGRHALNFSQWGNSSKTGVVQKMQIIRKTVLNSNSHEPLYYALNPHSGLTPAERTILLNWIDTFQNERFTGFKNSGSTPPDKNC